MTGKSFLFADREIDPLGIFFEIDFKIGHIIFLEKIAEGNPGPYGKKDKARGRTPCTVAIDFADWTCTMGSDTHTHLYSGETP